MAFYSPRNITPADQILFDANGDPVGIQPAGSSQPPLMGLTPTTKDAVQALVSEAGIGPERGDILTATPTPGWSVATYQWTRDGVDISGETSSTYTLTLADEGALIGCRAGSPVYTYLLEIPAGTYPSGYLSLNGGVLSLGSGVLSLV